MNMKIAEKLISLRKKDGLSQGDLAAKLGVSRQAVSKWECGDTLPDTENLIALSKLYKVTVDELICEGTQDFRGNTREPVRYLGWPFARSRKEWIIMMVVFSATAIVGLLILLGVIDIW